jgi:hypothetical protein
VQTFFKKIMGFILSHKNNKKSDSTLFKQIIDLVPKHIFHDAVHRFELDKGCSTYMTYDQFVSMTFRQLNKCLSLREINLGLGSGEKLLLELNINQSPAKSTMSDGNSKRNWKSFEHIYFELIKYQKQN